MITRIKRKLNRRFLRFLVNFPPIEVGLKEFENSRISFTNVFSIVQNGIDRYIERERGREEKRGRRVCLLNTVETKRERGGSEKGRSSFFSPFFKSRGSFYQARPVDACRRREFCEIEALLLN